MSDGGNTWQPPEPGAGSPPAASGGGFGPPTSAPAASGAAPAGDQASADLEPRSSGGGRSTGKVVAAVVGAVAIVAAGIFAITRISGDAEAGGASSPEGAAEALLDALDAEDVLGAVDVLLPGERETFGQPLQDFVSELQRLEVVSDDDLSSIDGVDVRVSDRAVEAEATNVDDIVNLTVRASVATSVDGEALPIGDWIRDNVDEGQIDELDEETPAEEGSFPVTAVREDGRWYLSLMYTVAEQARQQTDAEIPDEGIALNGGDSPEAAMDHFLTAASELDLAGMLGTLNPNEFAALQRYAPLFIDDAQAELDGVDLSVEIDDTAYDVEGDGSKRSISLTAASVRATAEGEEVTGRLEDGCWILASQGDEVNSCEMSEDVEGELDLDDVVEDPQEIEDAIADVRAAFDDYESAGFIVQEVDGAWYLSPMATVSDNVLAVVRALSREEIEELADRIGELAGTLEAEIDEQMEGGLDLPVLDDFEVPGRPDATPSTVAPDDPTADTATDPTTDTATESTAPVEEFGDACYAEDTAADAATCFDDLVTAGEIDPLVVPWYLRHPECGVAEAMWSGEYYALEDAEFVAAVEALQPCLQPLLASGDLGEFDVTGELAHPECLQGRNPYLLEEDDPAYEAFTDCAYG